LTDIKNRNFKNRFEASEKKMSGQKGTLISKRLFEDQYDGLKENFNSNKKEP
jgi:hypothetical protein